MISKEILSTISLAQEDNSSLTIHKKQRKYNIFLDIDYIYSICYLYFIGKRKFKVKLKSNYRNGEVSPFLQTREEGKIIQNRGNTGCTSRSGNSPKIETRHQSFLYQKYREANSKSRNSPRNSPKVDGSLVNLLRNRQLEPHVNKTLESFIEKIRSSEKQVSIKNTSEEYKKVPELLLIGDRPHVMHLKTAEMSSLANNRSVSDLRGKQSGTSHSNTLNYLKGENSRTPRYLTPLNMSYRHSRNKYPKPEMLETISYTPSLTINMHPHIGDSKRVKQIQRPLLNNKSYRECKSARNINISPQKSTITHRFLVPRHTPGNISKSVLLNKYLRLVKEKEGEQNKLRKANPATKSPNFLINPTNMQNKNKTLEVSVSNEDSSSNLNSKLVFYDPSDSVLDRMTKRHKIKKHLGREHKLMGRQLVRKIVTGRGTQKESRLFTNWQVTSAYGIESHL